MALKRRWLQSALEETKKPQPKMPWQARKLATATPKLSALAQDRTAASA